MKPEEWIQLMETTGRLKDMTRHSWTRGGRQESVADHSFHMASMAYFVQNRFPEADMKKIYEMCMLHDMGEAFTGDIPAFEKMKDHEAREKEQIRRWVDSLPEAYREKTRALFEEMEALETPEARIVKALDKLEAVIQHNEADLSTWLELEYELNQVYGAEYTKFDDFLESVRRQAAADTRKKLAQAGVCTEEEGREV